MKNIKYLQIVCLALIALGSCKEQVASPLDAETGAPAMVTNIKVENLAGAAKITYQLPNDSKLLYVKAQFMINGVLKEVKSSAYANSLYLEGFGKTEPYEVKLFSVSKSETLSKGQLININPNTAPYKSAFDSMVLKETFGGVTVAFNNPTEANLVAEILYKDNLGDWKSAETFYTKKPAGSYTARGFESKPKVFGVYIKDRWNNYSDTLVKELVPIFEKQLDRTKFQEVILPTDQRPAFNWFMSYLWDGVIVNNTNIDKPGFHTADNGVWPQWFTFSLGVKSKLSRFKFWQRGSFVGFADRNIKIFEVWGSNNPTSDGGWGSWTKLMDGEVTKPSGLPVGTLSTDDVAQIVAGEEFVFPDDAPEVKYIRIKVLDTWSGAHVFYIMQVAFWGTN